LFSLTQQAIYNPRYQEPLTVISKYKLSITPLSLVQIKLEYIGLEVSLSPCPNSWWRYSRIIDYYMSSWFID